MPEKEHCSKFTTDASSLSNVETFSHMDMMTLTRDAKAILRAWEGECAGFKEKV